MGYATAMWLSFGEALGAVAGALVGLLFVAVSVKSDVLAASRSLSSCAAQTLVLFMTSVLIAVLLVPPEMYRDSNRSYDGCCGNSVCIEEASLG